MVVAVENSKEIANFIYHANEINEERKTFSVAKI